MDVLLDNIVPIAIVILAILQGIGKKVLKDRGQRDSEDGEFELPDWAKPEPDETRTPPQPPIERESIPPPPRSTISHRPAPVVVGKSSPPAPPKPAEDAPPAMSALMKQLEQARSKREQALKEKAAVAEKYRGVFAKHQEENYVTPDRHSDHTLDWLHDPIALERAVIAREVLGPPISEREEWPRQRG